MKVFLKKIFLYLLLTAILCGSVNLLYLYRENSQNYGTVSPSRNDKAVIKDIPQNIEICNFGNSHSFYAFNYEDVQDKICFSFAMPDQSLMEDLQILKANKSNISPGAIVFISLSYTSLLGPHEDPSEPMDNRYYRFLPDEYIIGYDRKTDLYVNCFPALAENNMVSLFEKLLNINEHSDMWCQSTDAAAAARHGPMRYQGHVADSLDASGNRLYKNNELDCLYEIIDICKELDARPILLTVPFLREYTSPVFENDPSFYSDFYSIIESVCDSADVEYFDYSMNEHFIDRYDLFINSDHLNRFGAAEFTDLLLDNV